MLAGRGVDQSRIRPWRGWVQRQGRGARAIGAIDRTRRINHRRAIGAPGERCSITAEKGRRRPTLVIGSELDADAFVDRNAGFGVDSDRRRRTIIEEGRLVANTGAHRRGITILVGDGHRCHQGVCVDRNTFAAIGIFRC